MEETPGFSPALILSARKVTALCFVSPRPIILHDVGLLSASRGCNRHLRCTSSYFLSFQQRGACFTTSASKGGGDVRLLSPFLKRHCTVPCIHLPPLLEERRLRGTGEGAGTSALLPLPSQGMCPEVLLDEHASDLLEQMSSSTTYPLSLSHSWTCFPTAFLPGQGKCYGVG